MKQFILLILFFCFSLSICAERQYSLKTGEAALIVSEVDSDHYTLTLQRNEILCKTINSPFPVTLEVNGNTLTGYYTNIQQISTGELTCQAELKTPHGSTFKIMDTFSVDKEHHICLNRDIKVLNAHPSDKYFNSYFGWIIKPESTVEKFEFFVPGIWYKDNTYLPERALAGNYSDNYFYFREDRLPLPVVSAREKTSGTTFTLLHSQACPESFYGENGLKRIVDPRMKFGSLGFTQTGDLSMQFVYPGIEGERTYTAWTRDNTKTFSYRSHPVHPEVEHRYKLIFGTTHTDTYADLVEHTWKYAWENYQPPVHKMDVKEAYHASIEVLDTYLENLNGAPGWPFSIYLPNGLARAYNYQMGFIGFQLSNAYFLLRNGLENNNEEYIRRAAEVLDFWVEDSMTDHGLPRTWTDAYTDRKNTWRDYQTYMRSTAGGMEGLLPAWSIMKKHGTDKSEWLSYCKKYADWLVRNQNEDGSFFMRYQWETEQPDHESKYTTTNVIRFLVELYKVTQDERYLNTAVKAGNFSYDYIHDDYLYVGGVIDNPNVLDRESGQMAIYAFLALYDVTKDHKWKEAAVQSAIYTETFMFSYHVPMSLNDTLTDFPKHRDITGQTLIATGHSGIDNGLSFSSFQYYRLYLLTGDTHFLHVAKVIQNNTLQLMDLDGKMGYWYRGLVTECFNPQSNRGHSVRQQLPWNQAAILEPMHRFMDAFGEWDIDIIEQWPLDKRLEMMDKYMATQGLLTEK